MSFPGAQSVTDDARRLGMPSASAVIMVKFIGIVLILAAIGGFAYGVRHGGLRWSRSDRTGASQSEAIQTKGYSLPLAPIAAGICLVAGVIVVVVGARARA